ncbi:unnamed protein product [Tuber aestivum]|uniref:Uncharacterized protein n=1 Tax=Tuber aestivum TaxID=59557 RepID=A0A292PLA5_9PEZI|nr:unnamed protein product [Tuber aestivum]
MIHTTRARGLQYPLHCRYQTVPNNSGIRGAEYWMPAPPPANRAVQPTGVIHNKSLGIRAHLHPWAKHHMICEREEIYQDGGKKQESKNRAKNVKQFEFTL